MAGAELAGALSFVLRLGVRGLGHPLPISELPPQERRIAAALAKLGLLCPFKCASHLAHGMPAVAMCWHCGGANRAASHLFLLGPHRGDP